MIENAAALLILGTEISPAIRKAADLFHAEKRPVISVISVEEEPAENFSADYLIRKRKISAFFGTDLKIILREQGIDTVYVCGSPLEMDVQVTAIDCHQNNFHVHLLKDACTSAAKEDVAEAVYDSINYFQTGAVVEHL